MMLRKWSANKRLLPELKLQWQEILQPFGEQGYNSLKGDGGERSE